MGPLGPAAGLVVFRARATPVKAPERTPATPVSAALPEVLGEGMFDEGWQVVEESPLVVWSGR